MPLPKRPSGGAAPKKVAPPQFGEQENSAEEDFALPELEDFALPDLILEFEDEPKEIPSIPKAEPIQATTPDSSSDRFIRPESTNQEVREPAQAAVSDVLDTPEDEDEETALDRMLGLLDDDDFSAKTPSLVVQDQSEFMNENPVDNSLIELEENPSEDEDDEDEDSDFEDLLRGLEETVRAPDVGGETPETAALDDDWEAAFAELEAFNEGSLPEAAETDVETDSDEEDDEDEDEEEDEEEDGDWNLEEFTPPANPFETLPEDFQNVFDTDDEDEDEEEDDTPEEDFVPPSDPFANPFADEEITPDEEESSEDDEETNETSNKPSLKDKAAALLSPAKAKQGISDYFAKINAELHGEEPPKPGRRSERNVEEQDQEEESEEPIGGSSRTPIKIFGFLSPIRAFYTGIVNLIFSVLTAILGILSKLPLIGFVFKIALEATKVLRAIAQYIPLVFFIGALVAVSYFSVPRDSLIALPDSGGATFTEFTYDSASNSVTGLITNTGDIIADVQPEFTVKTIQPGLNPVSWVIPETTSKCVAKSVRVDIDSTTKVTAKCSDAITGFIPRVTGELK